MVPAVEFILLVPVGLLYLASVLVVPLPWLAGMYVLFAALVLFAVYRRSRPWLMLTTPVAGVVLWGVIVTLGEALFDWSA